MLEPSNIFSASLSAEDTETNFKSIFNAQSFMPETWRSRNDHPDSPGMRGIVGQLPMCYRSATCPSDVNRQGHLRNCVVPSPMLINARPIMVKNSSTTSTPRPALAPPLALGDAGDEALRCRDLVDVVFMPAADIVYSAVVVAVLRRQVRAQTTKLPGIELLLRLSSSSCGK